MGLLERWDERNQKRLEGQNAAMGGDDWAERLDARTPGPEWAHIVSGWPVVGWIGLAVIARDARHRRRRHAPGA